MRILITGGAGFIGSSLIKELIKKDPKLNIISLDNYSTGTIDNHIDSVKYLNSNTWNILELEELKNFNPDLIFHFGEFSRISQSLEEPNKTFKSNCFGTQQVLEYALLHNSKLIYSGSSAIFGNNGDDQHLNPYAWTKSKNIELINNYHKWYGLKFAICYFYNVYGPGQISNGSYATVIGIFEKQYINNEKLTIVSPGTQKRCFTHIDDIVNGILLVSEKGNGDNYHLGCNDQYSIFDIVDMFGIEYIFIKEKKGERETSIVPESKTEIELDWKAKIKIKDYINNFKKEN
jgi:UDP-glucose 4-epimerase